MENQNHQRAGKEKKLSRSLDIAILISCLGLTWILGNSCISPDSARAREVESKRIVMSKRASDKGYFITERGEGKNWRDISYNIFLAPPYSKGDIDITEIRIGKDLWKYQEIGFCNRKFEPLRLVLGQNATKEELEKIAQMRIHTIRGDYTIAPLVHSFKERMPWLLDGIISGGYIVRDVKDKEDHVVRKEYTFSNGKTVVLEDRNGNGFADKIECSK